MLWTAQGENDWLQWFSRNRIKGRAAYPTGSAEELLNFREETKILLNWGLLKCAKARGRDTQSHSLFFLKTRSGNISQECPSNKITCQTDKITMIQSANVMNRGAGSDTQGCAFPKFITDVSLGDRASLQKDFNTGPPLPLQNRKWALESGEALSPDVSQQSLLSE